MLMAVLQCPACGLTGAVDDEASFRLCGRYEQQDVRRCARCDAALLVHVTLNGECTADPPPAAVWEAMKASWRCWESEQALGWTSRPTVESVLKTVSDLQGYIHGFPDQRYLGVAAVEAVLELCSLEKCFSAAKTLSDRLRRHRRLSKESLAEATGVMTRAMWVFIVRENRGIWEDTEKREKAMAAFPLDDADHPTVERLASIQLVPARRENEIRFAAHSLDWIAGEGASEDRGLVDAWVGALDKGHHAMWDEIEKTMY